MPDAVVQELAGACADAAAPWPQVAELYAPGNVESMPLPRDTQEIIKSCSPPSHSIPEFRHRDMAESSQCSSKEASGHLDGKFQ